MAEFGGFWVEEAGFGGPSGLTMREVKLTLKAIAWWKVREVWREEARGRSKLVMLGRLTD